MRRQDQEIRSTGCMWSHPDQTLTTEEEHKLEEEEYGRRKVAGSDVERRGEQAASAWMRMDFWSSLGVVFYFFFFFSWKQLLCQAESACGEGQA